MILAEIRDPFVPRPVPRPTQCRSIREHLDTIGLRDFDKPTLILVNGAPLLRAQWADHLGANDCVLIVTLPEGGGGGGKNPLRLVLMIAVAVFAPYIAPALGTALGISTGLAQGLFSLVGGALINALIPPAKPKQITPPTIESSPTYSLQAQGNTARLGQAIPVMYGRHVMFPDFAAQPYQEYDANDDQFLYQVYSLGHGTFDIEAVRLEDSPVTSFAEVTYAQYDPGDTIALFHPHVSTAIEVSGQELFGPNMADYAVVGPFATNQAGTTVDKIGCDVVFPGGLYYLNGSSIDEITVSWKFEYRSIDDDGNPTGAWATLGTESITSNQTSDIRRTYSYNVSSGRYEVRASRTSSQNEATEYINRLLWAGLRGYMTDTATVNDSVTVLAVKMKATNNISSQASRKLNVIATRKLAAWSTGSQSFGTATASRSLAWALADMLTADYGGRLSNSKVDLDGLAALHEVWAGRGDTFDGIFDQRGTLWEALTRAARAGRAVPVIQGGVVRFIRDSAQTVTTALFTPDNLVAGTLNIQYLTPTDETPDAVTVRYIDQDTWRQKTVTQSVAGSSEAQPAIVDLFGVVNGSQAQREAEYMAKANRYRRKIVSFETEMEGHICVFGDLIRIAHDLPQWGQYSATSAWNPQSLTLTLEEPVEWSTGQTHYVGLRARDGSMAGPYQVTQGADESTLVLAAEPEITPIAGDTLVAFGYGNNWTEQARVLSVRPVSDTNVQITAVVETLDSDGNIATLYGGKKGLVGANSLADYTGASAEELAAYAWIGNGSGVMSDGAAGWTIGQD